MKKIILMQIPVSVEQALREHLGPSCGLELIAWQKKPDSLPDLIPDLVLLGEGVPTPFPGCPVLSLSWARPWRLGTMLRQIGQMLLQPILYMDDVAVGFYTFKPQEKILARADGTDITLTDREVDILAYLSRRLGKTVTRDELLKNVWQYQEGVDTHTLETHIYRLRQKAEMHPDDQPLLLTVDGGYSLHLRKTEV